MSSQFTKVPTVRTARIYIILTVIFICLLSILGVNSLFKKFEETQIKNRTDYLQQNLEKATIEFEKGIEKYALLVSSLKLQIENANILEDEKTLQRYLIEQLRYTNYGHSIIINYIDKNHNFVYSITETDLSPNNLKGINVLDIRDTFEVNSLNRLFQTDELLTFPLINLIEGFAGFPMNFRVIDNGELKGYMAPIINVKNIIEPIYSNDLKREFTYRFSFGNDVLFDREMIHNDSEVFNPKRDTSFLNLPKDEYLINELLSFGMPFSIGISYRDAAKGNKSFLRTGYLIILSFIILAGLLITLFLQYYVRSVELEKSNKNLSFMISIMKKFIYATSHDLKQPLVNISNFQGLFKMEYGQKVDAIGVEYLNIISTNVDSMKNILDDLLTYSKVLRQTRKKEAVDLNGIVVKIKSMYPDSLIEIVSPHLPVVHGVPSEILKLFENLVSNSLKFNNSKTPRVEILVKEKLSLAEITICDNGIGIEKDHLNKIFDHFQRVDKRKYDGTGLGLAICKEIVKNHGGEIRAVQNEIGGTNIIFTLKKHV